MRTLRRFTLAAVLLDLTLGTLAATVVGDRLADLTATERFTETTQGECVLMTLGADDYWHFVRFAEPGDCGAEADPLFAFVGTE